MPDHTATLSLQDPDATRDLARAIGLRLCAGDTILLAGDVGAGKTHFARALILSHLDSPEDVPSPTYTLIQTYPGRACDIWHADLYRLTDLGEMDELGLLDAFEDAICLVEWPDCLGDEAPDKALWLTLDAPHGDDRRDVTLSWSDPKWDEKLQEVVND